MLELNCGNVVTITPTKAVTQGDAKSGNTILTDLMQKAIYLNGNSPNGLPIITATSPFTGLVI